MPLGLISTLTQGAQGTPVGIDEAIGLESGQPALAEVAHRLEIVQATVPTVEEHTLWPEGTLMGALHQRLKVVVLAQTIRFLVVEAVVTGYLALAIAPQ